MILHSLPVGGLGLELHRGAGILRGAEAALMMVSWAPGYFFKYYRTHKPLWFPHGHPYVCWSAFFHSWATFPTALKTMIPAM